MEWPTLTPRIEALEAKAPVPGPQGAPGKDGAASTVPGPKGDTGATGPASTVPGPRGDTGAAGPAGVSITGPAGKDGTNANLVAATLTSLGSIKANVTQIARTTNPVSASLPSISVLGLSLLPSVSVSVPGVQLGDFVQATFAAAPPTGLTITGAQATAAGTVLVTFQATQALTLAASTQSLNLAWTR